MYGIPMRFVPTVDDSVISMLMITNGFVPIAALQKCVNADDFWSFNRMNASTHFSVIYGQKRPAYRLPKIYGLMLDNSRVICDSIPMINNIEVVNGIVIGPVTKRFALFTPNGTQYGNPRFFESDAEGREWANETRNKAIADCGQDEAKRLNWLGKWELRIWED